jgi:hypothetical protein
MGPARCAAFCRESGGELRVRHPGKADLKTSESALAFVIFYCRHKAGREKPKIKEK